MNDEILIQDETGVRTIRFNRASKKNAITQSMYEMMAEALKDANDSDVAAIIFLGLPGIFTAGNDIGDFLASAMASDPKRSPTTRFLKLLATTEKPVLAATDGLAIGIGVTMLMHCDMVFSSPRSTFKTPFLNLGVVPEAASSLIAPKIMGPQRAFDMLIMGSVFSAVDAQQAGLVSRVIESDSLEENVFEAAQKLASMPPEALSLSRKLLRGDLDPILARIDEETALFTERLQSDEAREAFTAFMEKRPPNFKNAS